jgi:ketosteroid isomerase-like protein
MSKLQAEFHTPQAVETAFYTAFTNCDVQAMDTVWADDNVICIHPGSSVLVGHEAVMRSWMNILTDAEPPNLHVQVLYRHVGTDLALHVVEEQIIPNSGNPETTSVVLATNIYRSYLNGWRMVEHHASLCKTARRRHTLQ